MLLFPAANDLLTLFVALEVFSLPLYLLCGLARRRRLMSQEAAVKYFLLGAFSSAFFLFGIACSTATPAALRLRRHRDAAATTGARRPAAARRASPCSSSACCSRSAPCRSTRGRRTSTRAPRPRSPGSWRPAPRSPRSARCCGCSTSRFGGVRWDWRPMIWGVAILTMLVGAVLAITQTDVKRMLAYSSIAHAGFLLTGVIALDQRRASRRRCSTCSPTASRRSAPSPSSRWCATPRGEATHLSQWAGLGRRSPLVAGVFAFFLLALRRHPAHQRVHRRSSPSSPRRSAAARRPLVVVGVLIAAPSPRSSTCGSSC